MTGSSLWWKFLYLERLSLYWDGALVPLLQQEHRQQYMALLTHWGRVTHIGVSKITIIGLDNGLAPVTIGSDNSLSPGRRQAIILTNAAILLIRTLGANFSEILSEIHTLSFKKCIWKCRLRIDGNFYSMC